MLCRVLRLSLLCYSDAQPSPAPSIAGANFWQHLCRCPKALQQACNTSQARAQGWNGACLIHPQVHHLPNLHRADVASLFEPFHLLTLSASVIWLSCTDIHPMFRRYSRVVET